MARALHSGFPWADKGPPKSLRIKGFKSIRDEVTIDLKPLTILAGANSSGKSSAMQTMLLLKQTLDAQHDPGPLLLTGPNVRFSRTEDILSHGKRFDDRSNAFEVGFDWGEGFITHVFSAGVRGIKLDCVRIQRKEDDIVLREGLPNSQARLLLSQLYDPAQLPTTATQEVRVERERFLLHLNVTGGKHFPAFRVFTPLMNIQQPIKTLIHLPGLRGNPLRLYPRTQIGDSFPGVFQEYAASIIAEWKSHDSRLLEDLGTHLRAMGLTWKVDAKEVDETSIEIKVGRLTSSQQGGAQDLVSIADVGLGVSQVLPVVVAVLVATKGQIVYLEQPEIHLHPLAQVALADLLIVAAKRGVIVVVETHSALLLRAIQRRVAEDHILPDSVGLNWFKRDPLSGITRVISRSPDSHGRTGDWPEDFSTVEQMEEEGYLEAALRPEKDSEPE